MAVFCAANRQTFTPPLTPDSSALVGLPVAVFTLACRKDFKAIPALNKAQVLELARCEWIEASPHSTF